METTLTNSNKQFEGVRSGKIGNKALFTCGSAWNSTNGEYTEEDDVNVYDSSLTRSFAPKLKYGGRRGVVPIYNEKYLFFIGSFMLLKNGDYKYSSERSIDIYNPNLVKSYLDDLSNSAKYGCTPSKVGDLILITGSTNYSLQNSIVDIYDVSLSKTNVTLSEKRYNRITSYNDKYAFFFGGINRYSGNNEIMRDTVEAINESKTITNCESLTHKVSANSAHAIPIPPLRNSAWVMGLENVDYYGDKKRKSTCIEAYNSSLTKTIIDVNIGTILGDASSYYKTIKINNFVLCLSDSFIDVFDESFTNHRIYLDKDGASNYYDTMENTGNYIICGPYHKSAAGNSNNMKVLKTS